MIGQRQSRRVATTGGPPSRLGRLTLRARAWLAAFLHLHGCRLLLARTIAGRAIRRYAQGIAAGPRERPLLSRQGKGRAARGMRAGPPAPEASVRSGAGCATADRDLLAISGGGDNGAFGSGVLVGWTKPAIAPSSSSSRESVPGPCSHPSRSSGRPKTSSSATCTQRSADDILHERGLIRASSMMRCPTPRPCGS